MKQISVNEIKTYVTAPAGINLVVVKIETSEAGLVGYGCATFTWRYKAVVEAIDQYLRPMLIGKNVQNIEDIWQSAMGSSYWRNSPVLNNALSGIDEALWDIKGKLANMPLYDLFGGKAREGILVYRHADGPDYSAVAKMVQDFLDQGISHIRCQMGTYGGNAQGNNQRIVRPEGSPEGAYFSPRAYRQATVAMFEKLRSEFGYEVEFLHDVHERLTPVDALTFARDLEPFSLFFLEDVLPPDQIEYLEKIRNQTTVPLAIGELFTHPLEWKTGVQNQWIDYMRAHVSDIGGLTPARKLAMFCETYAVRTAWHGPPDMSPIGAAAQMHLDLNSPNFGIQEFSGFTEAEQAIFPGCPEIKGPYAYLSDSPGIGVGFDETEALKYPPVDPDDRWLYSRLPDGTAVRP